MQMFPRTEVAGVSLPRMLMGSNWILGYSHTSSAADCLINRRNRNRESISELAQAFLSRGIDACMAPFTDNPVLVDGIHDAEDKLGHGMTLIDTPIINVDLSLIHISLCIRDSAYSLPTSINFSR